MPTGYTSAIYEGESTSLRDYILKIAHGMGWAIHLRDSGMDAPIEVPEEDSYYESRLPEAQAEIVELHAWDEDRKAREASQAYLNALNSWQESQQKKRELYDRYTDMIHRVEAWNCDPLMESTKQFALEQLRESRDFDTWRPGEDRDRWKPDPADYTPSAYYAMRLESAARSLKIVVEGVERDRDNRQQRREHIKALHRSLEGVE
jgi:hypothetical protein